MRKYYYVFILLSGILLSCDTKDTVDPTYEDYFIKFFGNNGDQTGKGIIIDATGIYMVGTTPGQNQTTDIYMVKSDFTGNVIWENQYPYLDESRSLTTVGMVRDESGNFYVAANLEVQEDVYDIYVVKIGPEGNRINEAVFFRDDNDPNTNELNYTDVVESISIMDNGQVLVAGWTGNVLDKTLPSNIADVYSLQLTQDLVAVSNVEWRQISGFRESMDLGQKIVQARPGGRYFFIGTTDKSDGTGITAQTNLISFPLQNDGQFPAGDVINGTTSIETAADITPTSGGDVVALWNSSTGFNSSTIYLAYAYEEEDYSLNTGASLPYNNAVGKSIIQSQNGGFIILAEQINNNSTDIFLIRTDQNFDVIWYKMFGGLENEEASQVAELEDGSIVLTGTVTLESQTKMFLIKTKSNGELQP